MVTTLLGYCLDLEGTDGIFCIPACEKWGSFGTSATCTRHHKRPCIPLFPSNYLCSCSSSGSSVRRLLEPGSDGHPLGLSGQHGMLHGTRQEQHEAPCQGCHIHHCIHSRLGSLLPAGPPLPGKLHLPVTQRALIALSDSSGLVRHVL